MPRGKMKDVEYANIQAVAQKFTENTDNINFESIFEVYCRKTHFKGNFFEICKWLYNSKQHYKYDWFLNRTRLFLCQK